MMIHQRHQQQGGHRHESKSIHVYNFDNHVQNLKWTKNQPTGHRPKTQKGHL